jgi:excisionase family DNA binding protein
MPENTSVGRLTVTRPVGRRYAKIREAADYVGVHQVTVRKWADEGKIRLYRSGARLVRVDLDEIDALLAEGE